MKAVFLSDAHIRRHDDPHVPPLLDFLEHLRGRVDRLVIVGDLFDTWFSFPRAVFDEYVPLLGALHALRRSGAAIAYVTGNHDFEMRGFITDVLCAEVHDTEWVLEADGRRAYVAHGDMIDATDRAYRRMRWLLRARPTRWIGRHLPPGWVWAIAQRMTDSWTGEGAGRTRLVEIFDAFARQKQREGFDPVILGHLHIPSFAVAPAGTYVNLGEWVRARTFLAWDDGQLQMKQWAENGEREMRIADCGSAMDREKQV